MVWYMAITYIDKFGLCLDCGFGSLHSVFGTGEMGGWDFHAGGV